MDTSKADDAIVIRKEPIINQCKAHTDIYAWEAIYNDGTRLREWCLMDGQRIIAARYDDIQRDRLIALNLYRSDNLPTDSEETIPTLILEMQSGYRLIWRKKRRQRMIGPQTPFLTIYLLGWQETINGRNIQSIIYIYHDESKPHANDDIIVLSGGKSNNELLNFKLLDFESETP